MEATIITTPNSLIQDRNELVTEIKNSWKVISENNIIKKGTTSDFDLKAILKSIQKAEIELIVTKLKIQVANFGFTNIKQLPKNNCIMPIITLSQVKERMVKLNLIPTKKEENETVIFTRKFIEDEIAKLALSQKKIELQLKKFNESIEFEAEVKAA